MTYDDEWTKIREDALKYMKAKRENPIKEFMEKIGIEDSITYEYLANYTTLVIYTKHPGIWIGKQGRDNLLLKEILKTTFGHDVEVEYRELKENSGFIRRWKLYGCVSD